jgi:hypothetical protein
MNELAELTITAHGGLERWKGVKEVSAHLIVGGALWALKNQPDTISDTTVAVGAREEWASNFPFGEHRYRTKFSPGRVALEAGNGELLSELRDPRASFHNHVLNTPWSDLQLAYFAGYAMWTYLNTPFLLADPGVVAEEVAPWSEQGETWRRLEINFPTHIATHSTKQTLYVDEAGLLRRHDYDVEIAGGTPAAQYISDYVEVAGLMFPTRRRVFPRQADGSAAPEPLIVSIDVSDLAVK